MKEWFRKGVLPIVFFIILIKVGYPYFMVDNHIDILRMMLIIGIPYGIPAIRIWLIGIGFDAGGFIGILALNIILAAIFGFVIAIVKVIRAGLVLSWGSIKVIRGNL